MNTSISNWCLICVVVLLVVAGFVGTGSAQQTANATGNTTTATIGQGIQTTEDTTAGVATVGSTSPSSASSTTSIRSSTATPEANDVWRNATPINTGRTVNETLPVGDQDWFVFTLESSGRITVRLAAANQTNMSGFLYNSEGDLLDSSYVAPGGQILLTGQASSEGEYYVFVRNEANNTPGAYAFKISIGESEVASGEDQPQTAAETSNRSGPGFGFLGGLASVAVSGYLFARATSNSR